MPRRTEQRPRIGPGPAGMATVGAPEHPSLSKGDQSHVADRHGSGSMEDQCQVPMIEAAAAELFQVLFDEELDDLAGRSDRGGSRSGMSIAGTAGHLPVSS